MIQTKDSQAITELTRLHDEFVNSIQFDTSDPDERRLSLIVVSSAPANGSHWRIVASGVFLFRLTAWGHVQGGESINTWDEGVSAATRAELERGRAAGLHIPPLAFTVAFHSGSHFELVCERIEIESLPS